MELILIGLAIIEKNGKILIGQRRQKAPLVRKLTWVFPGGRLETTDFEAEIKREVKEETGLSVSVGKLVHARLIPDSPEKKTQVLALYFYCKVLGGKEKREEDFTQLKWVKPTETYEKYFTTSTANEVKEFLKSLTF